MRRRRLLLGIGSAVALGGCGFELRRAPELAFKTLYTNFQAASGLGNEFKRAITATGQVSVTPDPASAQVILEVLQDQREKAVVAYNSAGQVREFQLRLRLRFKMRNQAGRELVPETEILQTREISFLESAILSKEAEEQLLYRDMQSDIVQQLLRRLSAVHAIA